MREQDLKTAFKELNEKFVPKTIVAGFDGFIDEIIHIVDTYTGKDTYNRIETIADFAVKVSQAAGLSANFEYKTIQKKLGGNGPIIANALLSQGNKIHYYGALGLKSIDPVFQKFADHCESVSSIADPGYTEALEFADGKLMMGKVDCLNLVNWDNLVEDITLNRITEVINNSELICCTNWTNLYKMNSILEGLGNLELTKRIPLFIDLADPRKRSVDDIKGVLKLISELESKYEVILGLNEKESILISEVLSVETENTLKRSKRIRDDLEITCCVIHPVKYAVASTKHESIQVEGPYCAKPKLSTGAGDNFNAGFSCGFINGLSLKSSLYLGTCTSGFYVRNMHSPNIDELRNFIEQWANNNVRE